MNTFDQIKMNKYLLLISTPHYSFRKKFFRDGIKPGKYNTLSSGINLNDNYNVSEKDIEFLFDQIIKNNEFKKEIIRLIINEDSKIPPIKLLIKELTDYNISNNIVIDYYTDGEIKHNIYKPPLRACKNIIDKLYELHRV